MGFRVVDELAGARARLAPRDKFGAELSRVTLGGERVLLCKPMEFMNVSGQAVRAGGRVLEDPSGRRRSSCTTSSTCRSAASSWAWAAARAATTASARCIADLGTPDFARVRVGIGRPPPDREGRRLRARRTSRAPSRRAPDADRSLAADAVEAIVTRGLTAAMNKFNAKPKSADSKDRGTRRVMVTRCAPFSLPVATRTISP